MNEIELHLPTERQQLRRLRIASTIEGLTLVTLLFVAVPIKHLYHMPIATRVMGPIHGLAFLAYFWTIFATLSGMGWSRNEMLRLCFAAFIPFGALATLGMLRKKEASLSQ